MPQMKAQPDWLRAGVETRQIGVDRENGVINGYVMAQEGPFKSEGRGEFDLAALKKIVSLARKQPAGLKSRLAHPSISADGISKFLGRAKDVRLDSVKVMRDGELVLLHAVRGDLHLDSTALDEPVGGGKPLGAYVMDLAESDPDAMSSSLVLKADQELRMDPKTKRPMLDKDGKEMPPLWIPRELHASDVVDTGDACDGFLSADGLPDEVVRKGAALLDQQFSGQSREVIQARATAWLNRYLNLRFGEEDESLAEVEEVVDAPPVVPAADAKPATKRLSKAVAELRTTLAAKGASA